MRIYKSNIKFHATILPSTKKERQILSDRIRSELIHIANKIEEEGFVTDQLRQQLEKLLSNAALLIALGPTAAFIRHDESENREYPDQLDFEFYDTLVKDTGFNDLFFSDHWGKAWCTVELANFKEHQIPALKVSWENKVAMVKDSHNQELFNKLIEPYLAQISIVFASKWVEWKVELE